MKRGKFIMTGKTHMIIGIAAGAGISALCLQQNHSLLEMGLFTGMTAVGSLIPDVDHPNSTISRCLPPVARLLYKFYCAAGKMFGDDIAQVYMLQHRGICHSFSACLSTILLLSFILFLDEPGVVVLWGIVLGMLLHILADSLTPAGTMLLAPFSIHYFIDGSQNQRTKAIDNKPVFTFQKLLLFGVNLLLSMSWLLYFLLFVCIFNFVLVDKGNFSAETVSVFIFVSLLLVVNILLRYFRNKALAVEKKSDITSVMSSAGSEIRNNAMAACDEIITEEVSEFVNLEDSTENVSDSDENSYSNSNIVYIKDFQSRNKDKTDT